MTLKKLNCRICLFYALLFLAFSCIHKKQKGAENLENENMKNYIHPSDAHEDNCGFYLSSEQYFTKLNEMKNVLNKTEIYWDKVGQKYSQTITAPWTGSVNQESAIGRFNSAWNSVETNTAKLQKMEESIDKIVRYRLDIGPTVPYTVDS